MMMKQRNISKVLSSDASFLFTSFQLAANLRFSSHLQMDHYSVFEVSPPFLPLSDLSNSVLRDTTQKANS
jgi:hypothetical protein